MGINASGQVVGASVGPSGARAFLWQDGVMRDLNELAGPGLGGVLVSAQHINDAGVITGRMLEQSTGRTLPVVLRP